MIDIHSHILPGIDDGALSLADAVRMCRSTAEDGCTAIIATPHQRTPSWENLAGRELEALHRQLQQAVGDQLEIHLGGEIRVDSQILEAVASYPASGIRTLAGSRYLLLELDRGGMGPDPTEILHEVGLMGWRPVVAHPELYRWLEPDRAADLVDAGALLQVTAMSLTGDFGRIAHRRALALLDEGLVSFVASDCHSPDQRPPGLSQARDKIRRHWGEASAEALTRTNPEAVLTDGDIA